MALSDRPRSRYEETLGDTSQPSQWVGARMTLAEFLALPEEKPYLEWDASLVPQHEQVGAELVGVVTQKCGGDADHSSIQSELLFVLGEWAEARRLGLVFPELQMVVEDAALTADISYYRREKIRRAVPPRYIECQGAPDLVIEVASPGESIERLTRKCLRYLEHGSTVACAVDREDRSVLVFRAEPPDLVLRGNDRIDIDDIVPGFELTVKGLFAAAAPPAWLFDDAAERGEALPCPDSCLLAYGFTTTLIAWPCSWNANASSA